VQDVSSDLEIKSPRARLVIDRDKAAAMALDPAAISGALYSGFGPRWSSTIYGDEAQYRVLLELDPRYQTTIGALGHLAFKSPRGAMVPLDSVVRTTEDVSPQTVNHSGQLPAVAISFGLRQGVALGDAVDSIRALGASFLPATMTVAFEGSAKAFEESVRNLGLLLVVAIGVVYIVLGMLYESYIHPLTILSGLPSAGLGALLTLWLFGNELNVYSFVGLIMLDHDGGAARRPADCARARRWWRGATAARARGRWRPSRVPADHALPHARRLHVPGEAGAGQAAVFANRCDRRIPARSQLTLRKFAQRSAASRRTPRRSTLPVPRVGMHSTMCRSSRLGTHSFGKSELESCSQTLWAVSSGSV